MTPLPVNRDSYRKLIDDGLTGDKIPAIDPSVAPIVTDSEAAACPTPDSSLACDFALLHDMAWRAGAPVDGRHPHSAIRVPPSRVPWLVVWTATLLGALAIVLAALQIQ